MRLEKYFRIAIIAAAGIFLTACRSEMNVSVVIQGQRINFYFTNPDDKSATPCLLALSVLRSSDNAEVFRANATRDCLQLSAFTLGQRYDGFLLKKSEPLEAGQRYKTVVVANGMTGRSPEWVAP